MALFPVKLSVISRVFFFVFVAAQAVLLSQFLVDHEKNNGFYGLVGLFGIPLGYWFHTLRKKNLKRRLSVVWLLYSCALVIMVAVIFGWMLIQDNKLREQEIATCLYKFNTTVNYTNQPHSFFDSKFLKITLCFTPGLMLLLLTSVTDENGSLKQLYLTTVMDLFDGIEMVEVLHEDICNKIPMEWEIAVLIAALLFFILSPLEVYEIKFDRNGDSTQRKKTAWVNIAFQIFLNLAFLIILLVLWFYYDFDSAVFLAKNMIGLVIALVGVLEECKVIRV